MIRKSGLFIIALFAFFVFFPGQIQAGWNLSEVDFWAYQIQSLDKKGAIKKIIDTKFDLLVLEPADFKNKKFIKRIKASEGSRPGVRKRVFAYLDIGEAENWRWYWQDDWKVGSPDFIITEDPDGWSGNFPVSFWRQEWKDIIIYNENSSLNQVLDDGFDGLYMDWIEAYADPDVKKAAAKDGVETEGEMIKFIQEIKIYAQQRKPKFKLIAQNGADLVIGHNEYLEVIDAIAQENITYRGKADVKWKSAQSGNIKNKWRKWDRMALKPYKKAGLPVFSIDYATRRKNIDKAYDFALNHGYIPLVSRTPLSRLPKNRPPGYPE